MGHGLDLVRTLGRIGAGKLTLHTLHRLRLRVGWYEWRLPVREWSGISPAIVASARSTFLRPDLERIRDLADDREEAIIAGERILAGELLYFSAQWFPRPLDWQSLPGMVDAAPSHSHHWIRATAAAGVDVKWIWEPSRFDWLYSLGRAWALSGDERFIEGALDLIADWRRANPPNRGINWNCAQECSIRLFALLWAVAAFGGTNALTAERHAMIWETVTALAERVAASTIYSRAQGNNHLLAESGALYVAGRALPAHPEAAWWISHGRRLFIAAVREQFANDGSYAMHSTNYTREALRDCAIVMLAAQAGGDALPSDVSKRLNAAARLLNAMLEPRNGHVPNYGPNDGSNYMSLSGAPYRDFRPIVQTISLLTNSDRLYERGPHDEEVDGWRLAGHSPPGRVAAAPPVRSLAARDGGYFVARGSRTWAMLRCQTLRTRPTQSDMLHLDLWCDGLNLLTDSGTFQYSGGKEDWGSYFESTSAHNTVVVNGRDPMWKAGRFLWLNWTKARLLRFEETSAAIVVAGEHYGYQRDGVVHRRTVHVHGDEWLVVDDLLAAPGTRYGAALRWHLDPAGRWRPLPDGFASDACALALFLPGATFHRGGTALPDTMMSRYYGHTEPAHLIELRWQGEGNSRRITVIGSTAAEWQGDTIVWNGMRIAAVPPPD